MKKSLIASTLLLAANCVFAGQSPNWDTLSVSYHSSELEDLNLKGFGLSGTKLISDDFFISGSYSSISDDITIWTSDINLEYDNLGLGLGFRQATSENTDFFAIASIHRLEYSVSSGGDSESTSDTGLGLQAGVRTMANEKVELSASLSHISVEDESEFGINVAAMFHLTPNFGLGFGFGKAEDTTNMNATASFFFN